MSAIFRLPESLLENPHIQKLLSFGEAVLRASDRAGVSPILDGSLAVHVYTSDPEIKVRDMDLNCPEASFPGLRTALDAAGIFCEIQPWRVLQARRDGLKVEFGATEEWLKGIDGPFEQLLLSNGRVVQLVTRDDLVELYWRGYIATEGLPHEMDKHEHIKSRLEALRAI